MLSSHYQPINECIMPQYHFVVYGDGLGRWCTTLKLPRNEVSTRGAPNFPYHRLDCHIVILVLSTSYQWMAGAIPYADDIRGRSGAANAGG